ncbi:odorant receptor 4-like [Frieseomelitta varia]|uniref:odorant receptor 4-like n=1 Tax=Frieseomelitta varia TaxID=561572 RepID=UPI001CB6B1F3|nr:odorant receptor 4-like [Frieseomelitta varia]
MTDELRTIERKFGNLSKYSIQVNQWILKPIGAWPITNSTTTVEKITTRMLTVVCWCFSLFTIIPGVLNIMLEKEDIYLKLKTLGPLSHWCVGGFNYAVLLLRKNDIHYCIEHIRTDWKMITRSEDQQVMLKNAKLGRYVAGFCAAFMHGGVFCTCLVLGAFKRTIEIGNETMAVYTLPCPAYKFPVQTNPTHDIILGTQFLSAFIASSSAAGAFSLATVFASHAVGQLSIMTTWVDEFVNRQSRDENNNDCVNKIGIIVEHHLRVLSFIARIEQIMSPICFMEIFKCMLGMCMPSYYILAEWSEHNIQNLTSYVMIIISMTCNIFLVCYIGEVLSEKCKKIGDMVYMTNWYHLPDKNILSMIMIISRSSVEVKMTAGKIIDMSVFTFASIVKTVFAYLNMLCQTTMM